MKTRKFNPYLTGCAVVVAAFALLPGLAHSGDLTGSNNITGAFSSASGFQNVVPGNQAFVSGQQSNVGGDFNSAFGFGHVITGSAHLAFGTQHNVNGGGNAVFGFQNQAGAPSLYNFVTGSFNNASGANTWIGGSSNTSTGNRSLLFGQFLDDGGLAGSVMLSDSNPFNLRTAAAPFTNATPNTFNGTFDRGYFLFTNDGQGANPDAGLFVVPTPANTAATSNPAFVGINTRTPTAALDVAGDIKQGTNSQFFATADEEKLRILRGTINSAGVIQSGTGFSAVRLGLGSYRITFNTAFSSNPSATVTVRAFGFVRANATTTQVIVRTANPAFTVLQDTNFDFIVAGPR